MLHRQFLRQSRRPSPAEHAGILDPLAFEQLGHVARQSRSFLDEEALQRRHAVDNAEAELARGAQQRRVAGEQPVDAVERGRRNR